MRQSINLPFGWGKRSGRAGHSGASHLYCGANCCGSRRSRRSRSRGMAPATADNEPAPARAPVAVVRGPNRRLGWYYEHFFPKELFVRWLSYGENSYLSRREISFTLDGDVYLRWRSFPTLDDLMLALKGKTPVKIDIGAVYNFPPAEKNSMLAALMPLQKELVFDIDMTDYADVMGDLAGGSEVESCDRNWKFMAAAVKVIEAALREDFGFEFIMWIYSGRRGIHCWVADERARSMSNEQRSALADYMYMRFEGRENTGRRQREVTIPMHPALARAKQLVCDQTFKEFVLGEHGMLNTPERVQAILQLIPSMDVRTKVMAKIERDTKLSGLQKWEIITAEVAKVKSDGRASRAALDYIVFKHTYPRLDVNVSKEINHLLKAPFCVHPKTERVCVPFRAAEVDGFVPGEHVPCLEDLLKELKKPGEATRKMKEGLAVFEEFVKAIEVDTRRRAKVAHLKNVDDRNALDMMRD